MFTANPYNRVLPCSKPKPSVAKKAKTSSKKDVKSLKTKQALDEVLEYYSGEEVMQTYKVKQSWLYASVKRHQIPMCRIAGRNYYSKKHIDAVFGTTICSKEQDDELWAQFREVRDEFNAKKRAYFEELDKTNADRKAKKEDIIRRAKELLNIKNLRESNEKMDALMEEWKAVGYAGKEDESLWKDFSAVRKEFNQKKREHHEELLKVFQERATKKEEMILALKKLIADADFSDEEVKKVRNMQKDFDKIGFAGKEKDDDLYARFNELVKKYFEEKKFYTV